jgi:hypothetical protein
VQCLTDGGLVAVITERVCPTADVGRLAAGDRVVRSCRGACPAATLVGRSGRGPAASGRVLGQGGDRQDAVAGGVLGCGGIRGAQVLWARSLAPGEYATVLAVGAAIRPATRSHPCGCGRQAGSDPKRAAPLSHLLPRARLPTLGPLSRLPEIAVPEASGRASHGDSTLGAFLVFARLHARPSHTLPVKRVLRFDIAQPERRYDVTPVTRAGAYLAATRVASGGRGGQKSWIRRRGWHAGHEHGWLGCGCRCAYVMRWRWQHRGIGSAITLSKPTAHTDCVPADHHQVGSAHGGP